MVTASAATATKNKAAIAPAKPRKIAELLKANGNEVHSFDYVQERVASLVQREHDTLGKSREKLSRECGVNTSTLKDIADGSGNPTLATLTDLLKYWGMSWEEFGRYIDGAPLSSKIAVSSTDILRVNEVRRTIESALRTLDNLDLPDLNEGFDVMTTITEVQRSRLKTLLEFSLEYQGLSTADAAKALDLTPTTLAPFLGQLGAIETLEYPVDILDRIATLCCLVKSWKNFPVIDPDKTYKNWAELSPVLEGKVPNGV